MADFTFIHAADLHLGSPFKGIRTLDSGIADRLARATFDAYDRIIDLAIERRALFVLFAGDVYDAENGQLRAYLHFIEGLRRLDAQGIHTFIVRGNHDPLTQKGLSLELPRLAHCFPASRRPGPIEVLQDGEVAATVTGASFANRLVTENLAAHFPVPQSNGFHIAMLHTNCGGDTGYDNYAPCTVPELAAAGYHYWALGHIHKPAALREAGPAIIYSGSAQGLNPKETGPHGCCVVTVEGARIAGIEWAACGPVEWRQEELGIAGLQSDQDLLDALDSLKDRVLASTHAQGVLLRLRIAGAGPVHYSLKKPDFIEGLEESSRFAGDMSGAWLWTESIEDDTRPDLDLDSRMGAADLVGELLREASRLPTEAAAIQELRSILAPVYTRRIARDHLRELDDLEMEAVVRRAAVAAAELLIEGGGTE